MGGRPFSSNAFPATMSLGVDDNTWDNDNCPLTTVARASLPFSPSAIRGLATDPYDNSPAIVDWSKDAVWG